jgi:ribosomal protein S12 methylthiotransferase accessory factor
MADSDVLERLETLVSPFGVVAGVHPLHPPRGLGEASLSVAYVGDGSLLPTAQEPPPRRPGRRPPDRTTRGVAFGDPAQARLIAIAEAAERYSASNFDESLVCAAHRDLDGPALDPSRIPRCSIRELATPGCPLCAFVPDAPIRWVRGTDLANGVPTWVPAVMAFYGLRDLVPSERFWYRISTGFAVHSDPAEALVRGICEVIERDAIALTWLQELALPLVPDRCLSERTREVAAWAGRHFVDAFLFDATTDLAIPTVFCLQVAPYAAEGAQLTNCATGRSIASAAEKALLEGCATSQRRHVSGELPADFADFRSISDSARYMAVPSRVAAFHFLMSGARARMAPERESLPEGSADSLAWLIRTLSDRGMQAIAVDRTTSELAAVGLTAVNVIIPDLQPMSLHPLAQYRAHARLYSAPVLMGHPSRTEEELNPWPVPFA